MTKALAADHVRDGVRFNAICLGTVNSPSLNDRINAAENPAATRANFIARQPMGRLGTPSENATLAAYLAADESAFMTGSELVLDGGATNQGFQGTKMKLLRYGPKGSERPAIVAADGTLRDISALIADVDPETIDGLEALSGVDPLSLPNVPSGRRVGPCVGRPGKFICIGLNYADHAAETRAPIPDEPIIFMKAITAVCGPNDDIYIPPKSLKTDWEVELGIVIGKVARHVRQDDADDYIAGHCLINDVSERHYQTERGGTWDKRKGYDTFGPIGPWLVTEDEITDPQDLSLWLDVDGHRYQNGNTRTMIFGIRELVSYVSQFMSLQPGDIISTGTPPGVGLGQKPPVFLKPGQTIRLGIDGFGERLQRTVASPFGGGDL